jgi:hypothetical protein
MISMSDGTKITAIMTSGTWSVVRPDEDPVAAVRRLRKNNSKRVHYALIALSEELAEEATALEGPIRLVASPATDRQVDQTVRLVSSLTPAVEPPSRDELLQARTNAQLRTSFITNQLTYSSEDVASLVGSRAANRAATANRWRKEGLIFAVRHSGELRYPAFQFGDDGHPRPEIRDVLAAFAERHASAWEIALWFVTEHPRADGRKPVELLDENPRAVELLARQSLDTPE